MSDYSKGEALNHYETSVESLRDTFRCLEKIAPRFTEWSRIQRQIEEQEDTCDCVSSILEDSAIAMNVVMHVVQTYGMMLGNMSKHLKDHDHEEIIEVQEVPEEVLTDLHAAALRAVAEVQKSSGKKTRH